MRLTRIHLLLGLCAAITTLVACGPAKEPPAEEPPETAGFSTNPYCQQDVLLCSTLPDATIAVTPGCESYDQQCARDFWSWQNFVSLNWPGKIINQVVEPDPAKTLGDGGNRVWELWMDPDSVFLPNAVQPTWTPGPTKSPYCTSEETAGHRDLTGRLAKASVSFDLETGAFFEATIQQPLIDQAMNFVVFEIRMNMDEVGWVVSNDLYNKETVDNWSTPLTMPGSVIETKAAWRILPDAMPAAQKERYYRQEANIVLDPNNVEGGGSEPVCLARELGLIGLHIRHEGFWSTFEQVDNVTASGSIEPTLYNPNCTDCTVNVPPTDKSGNPIKPQDYKWSLTGASASLYQGFPNVPAQITYAPGETEFIDGELNTWWQDHVVNGTVWQHYMQITTNWSELPSAAQPIPALNTSLEPYLPPHSGTFPQDCIDCHKLARHGDGPVLAETFLVFRACPETIKPGQKVTPNCLPFGIGTLATSN